MRRIFPRGKIYMRSSRSSKEDPVCRKLLTLALAHVVEEHLFDGFVVGHHDVPHRVSADQEADLFRQVLGMIAGTLERLCHENHLQAGLALNVFRILYVTEKNQISQ